MAVVSIINSNTSKEPNIMKLVRKLVLLCMRHNILVKAEHYPGRLNLTCDFLSRDQVYKAKQSRPSLEDCPVVIPEYWTLDKWISLYLCLLWPNQLDQLIEELGNCMQCVWHL